MTFARSRAFAVIGQSYGQYGYDRSSAYGFFQEAIRRVIAADAAAIQTHIGGSPTIADGQIFQRRNYAVDGSAVLEKNKGLADNYWLENDGVTAGPRLTTAAGAIAALSQKPILTVSSHGEQDATATTTAALVSEITDGMAEIFSQLRTAMGDANAPVFADILGYRFASNEFNEYRLRDAMLDMIDLDADIFRGAEKYALQLDSTTHPVIDYLGYGQMGAHTGRKVAAWLVDGTDLRGPSIAGAVKTGSEVAVTITVPAGKTLVKPESPDFFGLFDENEDRVAITGYAWDGNVLTLTAENDSAAKLRYPARPVAGRTPPLIDISKIIRLSDPSSADRIYTGEPGLVLESAKTITL